MKKISFILIAVFSLTLIACSEENAKVSPQNISKRIKEKKCKFGVVHRVCESYFQYENVFFVRLIDGKVLKADIGNTTRLEKLKDFYFVQPGDTIVYDGDDIIEVRFKD